MRLKLTGVEDVVKNMKSVELNTIRQAFMSSQSFAGQMEHWARRSRPWTDRTGNAVASIYAVSNLESNNIIIYHGIGVDYGKYLELSNGGKYRVIGPSIQHHRALYSRMMSNILRK